MAISSQNIEERIYIGGLDPPRLSGKDVLRRLESLDQIEIKSASIKENGNDGSDFKKKSCSYGGNRPYLHITAISKEDSDSALVIIRRKYHNVKWKGCKIVVEEAKPHFLERLKQERRHHEREEKVAVIEEQIAINILQDQALYTSEAPSRIPRRLRVRKKHGDIAVHVDTKPWTVESWSRFNQARTKLKKRQETHNANVVRHSNHSNHGSFALSAPLIHRAVHIRFLREDGDSTNENDKLCPSGTYSDIAGIATSRNSSLSSSSSSDNEIEPLNDGNIDNGRGLDRYQWSYDDSDSQNSKGKQNDDVRDTNILTNMNQRHNKSSKATVEQQQNKDEVYKWSTDEESSDDDEVSLSQASSKSNQQLIPKKFGHADEFKLGFDNTPKHNENEDQNQDHLSADCSTKEENENLEPGLIDDVATNLNILSGMFPEIVSASSVNPEKKDSYNLDDESRTLSSNTNNNNSNSPHGIMPRYDPSAKSSRKYLVADDSTKRNEEYLSTSNLSSEEKLDGVEIDKDKCAKTDSEMMRSKTSMENVYEQEKLENVFRDARDAWAVEDTPPSMLSTFTTNINPDTSTGKNGFNFGFNLDENDNYTSKNHQLSTTNRAKETFSFSFRVADQQEVKQSISNGDDLIMEHEDSKCIQTKTMSGMEHSEAGDGDSVARKMTDDVRIHHKGWSVSNQDLQKYVGYFFECNNGISIMQNRREFNNDDEDRAAWNVERQTLTLDWKRKRKYAITRIKKRMKIQRR